MNPASVSIPASRGRPTGQGQTAVRPEISDDEELDQIMRDVGAQLNKEEFKKPKRRLLNFHRKPKREVPFSAQIVHHPQQLHKPQPAPVPEPKPVLPAVAVEPKPQPASQPSPRPVLPAVTAVPKPQPQPPRQVADSAEAQLAKIQPHPAEKPVSKPKKQVSYPVFVLFVTFLVTGFLIAAAIAAYRQ